LENKFLTTRNVEQREIFSGRSDEDHIVVFNVVEREQAPAFHSYLSMERSEHTIEFMYRQHFANASVVIENLATRVARRIQIPHSCLRSSNE